jgi:dienelactone hydrolase
MTTEHTIDFASAGRPLRGFYLEPNEAADGPRAGVMVLHGGAGVGAHERQRALMLSELGYVAFVPDLFGEVFHSRERGVAVITALVGDPPALRARLIDALVCMRSLPRVDGSRVAAVGFCFGGLAALELARSGADVRGVVSVHGGLTARAPAQPGRVKAAILVCAGAADPYVTREHRSAFEDEMTQAQADWQLQLYSGAEHGFSERAVAGSSERPGCRYHEAADRRSWAATQRFLAEALA